MKNRKFIAIAIACVAFTSIMAGCDQITTTTEVSQTEATTESSADNTATETETSSDAASQTVSSLDELNQAVGFTAYSFDSEAYNPVSYDVVDGNVAQIVYNHDGNTATLRVSSEEVNNLSDVTGTENAESYKISDYDLDIDIQESDNKYVAEWSAVDKNGNKMYYSLVEDNVDLAVFENTLSSYAGTALSEDQSSSNNSASSSSETDENGETKAETESEGEVIATCEDNMETYEFEVKEDGTYEFTDPVSDAETYWDIYVLDEQWEDGTRYIKQANDSKGQTPVTLDLKKGQWVYCFCSKDGFTTDEKINCKLTITKK